MPADRGADIAGNQLRPSPLPGRRDGFSRFLSAIKDRLLACGFSERDASLEESTFNSTSFLFVPSFIAARDSRVPLRDVLGGGLSGASPEDGASAVPLLSPRIPASLVDGIDDVHFRGASTRSRGWGRHIDRERARESIFRNSLVPVPLGALDPSGRPSKAFSMGPCVEALPAGELRPRVKLAGVISGEKENLPSALGFIGHLLREDGLFPALDLSFAPDHAFYSEPTFMISAGLSGEVKYPVGKVGMLRPELASALSKGMATIVFEIDLESLARFALDPPVFSPADDALQTGSTSPELVARVDASVFFSLLGHDPGREELAVLLAPLKADILSWHDEKRETSTDAPDRRELRIRLRDLARPDLLSAAGLARQLRFDLPDGVPRGDIPHYGFFSVSGDLLDPGEALARLEIPSGDSGYVAAFFYEGDAKDSPWIRELERAREALETYFQADGLAVAMCDAVAVSFPLQGDADSIFARVKSLSRPRVGGGTGDGVVKRLVLAKSRELVTAAYSVALLACDAADLGFSVHPFRVDCSTDTAFGESVVYPFHYQLPVPLAIDHVFDALGGRMPVDAARACLARAGLPSDTRGSFIQVFVPPWRQDILHPSDALDDLVSRIDADSIPRALPRDFTPGSLSFAERRLRVASEILIARGFREIVVPVLEADPRAKRHASLRQSLLTGLSRALSDHAGPDGSSRSADVPSLVFAMGPVLSLDGEGLPRSAHAIALAVGVPSGTQAAPDAIRDEIESAFREELGLSPRVSRARAATDFTTGAPAADFSAYEGEFLVD